MAIADAQLQPKSSRANSWLIMLGIISAASYLVGERSQAADGDACPYCVLAEILILFVGAWIVHSVRPDRWTLAIILAFALCFRLSVLFYEPQLSSDAYKYVWDGRVQAAGVNPYRYIPSAPELERLRDDDIQYIWYFSWLVPFLCFVPFFPLLIFTAEVFYLNQTALQDPGGTRFAINLWLYIPLLAFPLGSLLKQRFFSGDPHNAGSKAGLSRSDPNLSG
jgi:hypothetical protein